MLRLWTRDDSSTGHPYGQEQWAQGRTVAFYIDSNNSLQALINNSGNPVSIQARTALIWHRIRDIGIAPWFERVPSKRNIDDLHRRHVRIKYAALRRGRFLNLRKTHKLVEQAIQKIILGAPLGPPR